MELNKREAFFAAIFNGFLSHKDQFNDANPDEAIRECWAMADRIIYHSNRVESPREIANRWIKKNIVIVDTETTGLDKEAEIIEISIIDCTGAILLNTLIKPSKNIPAEATEIHGITNEMVEDAPSWKEMLPQVLELISHGWVAYNAKFDARMLEQTSGSRVDTDYFGAPECAMQLYAEYNGEWDKKRRKYKWRKLTDAATSLDAWPEEIDENPHRALYDCYLTLGVIRSIAGGKK